jgi:hypothetical protein
MVVAESNMSDDPDLSSEDSLNHIARMGLSIYRAVLRDGGNHLEAFNVTAAWFAGMMKGATSDKDNDE